MKAEYLKYYENITIRGFLSFFFEYLLSKSKLRKLSLRNRQRDYLKLLLSPEKVALHYRLNRAMWEGCQAWDGYDYGEGYFYQSSSAAGITGFRDTSGRVREMNLKAHVKGKRVLEIGCNSGFLTAELCHAAHEIVGIDVNPYLIEQAKILASYFDIQNTSFRAEAFEEYTGDAKFDVVLSFANHSTYDGKTHQRANEFFQKCQALLREGGRFLFESHPPKLEPKEKMNKTLDVISRYFEIETKCVLEYGGFLDRDRTFVVARRK